MFGVELDTPTHNNTTLLYWLVHLPTLRIDSGRRPRRLWCLFTFTSYTINLFSLLPFVFFRVLSHHGTAAAATVAATATATAAALWCCQWKHSFRVDQQSLQHLADFIDKHADSHKVEITELCLSNIELISDPSDGGLDVLTASDTPLTKVTLNGCNFGNQQDASQLLAAFHTNRTVTHLKIAFGVANLQDAALGRSLAEILQNMPQLQRLLLLDRNFGVEGAAPFNRHCKRIEC